MSSALPVAMVPPRRSAASYKTGRTSGLQHSRDRSLGRPCLNLRGEVELLASSRLVNKLIVHDRGCQLTVLIGGRPLVFGPHHAALADDIAVLLSGNFFRHLKHHLDQRVDRELRRPVEQHAALADVFDDAFVPGTGLVDAITQRNVKLEPARARHPRRPFLPRMSSTNAGLRLGMLHPFGAAHGGPIVFIFRGAQQADLVVIAIATTARPGKFVRAAPQHKHIHEFLRHCYNVRFKEPSDAGPSSRLNQTLGRLLSCKVRPATAITQTNTSGYPVETRKPKPRAPQ